MPRVVRVNKNIPDAVKTAFESGYRKGKEEGMEGIMALLLDIQSRLATMETAHNANRISPHYPPFPSIPDPAYPGIPEPRRTAPQWIDNTIVYYSGDGASAMFDAWANAGASADEAARAFSNMCLSNTGELTEE